MSEPDSYAGVELGGTKTIMVLAHGDAIVEQRSLPTQSPSVTLEAAREQLLRWQAIRPLRGLGIASFGPIRLDIRAPDYGRMLATPKPGWADAPVLATLTRDLACRVRIDTDVNAAALAEYRWGGGIGCDSLCYVTIGTGVGGGILIGGRPVHGALHPEIGHLRLPRAGHDPFPGSCPFHGDCIEGLVSGPALAQRFAADPRTIADDHPGWDFVASDLAELCSAMVLTLSAERVLFGGSVSLARSALFNRVRGRVVDRLAGYLPFVDADSVSSVIQEAALGTQAGPLGAIALAQAAARD
ncbi:ROK family protein [Sphingomonas sp. CJ99]